MSAEEEWVISSNGEDDWTGSFTNKADAIAGGAEILADDDPTACADENGQYCLSAFYVGKLGPPWKYKIDGEWVIEGLLDSMYDELGDVPNGFAMPTKQAIVGLGERLSMELDRWLESKGIKMPRSVESVEEVKV